MKDIQRCREVLEKVLCVERYELTSMSSYNYHQFRQALQTLITLADNYLACKGWPEEKKLIKTEIDNRARFDGDTDYEMLANCGFNQALHLCRVAALKERNKK